MRSFQDWPVVRATTFLPSVSRVHPIFNLSSTTQVIPPRTYDKHSPALQIPHDGVDVMLQGANPSSRGVPAPTPRHHSRIPVPKVFRQHLGAGTRGFVELQQVPSLPAAWSFVGCGFNLTCSLAQDIEPTGLNTLCGLRGPESYYECCIKPYKGFLSLNIGLSDVSNGIRAYLSKALLDAP